MKKLDYARCNAPVRGAHRWRPHPLPRCFSYELMEQFMAHAIEQARSRGSAFPQFYEKCWPFIVLGIALLGLGFLGFAILFAATALLIFYIGVLMSVAGIAQVVHAFNIPEWSMSTFWLWSGFVYAIAGVAAIYNPLLAASAYTLVLAITLIAAGILRSLVGLKSRGHLAWGWVAFSGMVTVLAGIVVLSGLPLNPLAAPGAVLAIDLTMQGATLLAFGFGLKSTAGSWMLKNETGEWDGMAFLFATSRPDERTPS